MWAGFGLIRGGPGTAIVGDPETISLRIDEYRSVGFDTFIVPASRYSRKPTGSRICCSRCCRSSATNERNVIARRHSSPRPEVDHEIKSSLGGRSRGRRSIVVMASAMSTPPAEQVVLRIAFVRGSEPMSIARLNGNWEAPCQVGRESESGSGRVPAYAPAAEGLNAGAIDMLTGSSTLGALFVRWASTLALFAYQWDAGDTLGILVKKNPR